ncbi:hypothetical protein SanaruYs_39780 [Chryseotalea sanaruensis]|uniref:Uncharacterized protein n=2 Tax=Chryseotalea sanaruensis TaxID=2482724 RepID=A0A401UFW2_9BACT|nr:hypothetical protein SanaruYs_39780 [Chryseotalea sanaruensis]
MKRDKGLLKALGYSDNLIEKLEIWDTLVNDYFDSRPELKDKNRHEPYFQVHELRQEIVFRDTCPKNIHEDLTNLFQQVFPKSHQ